MRRLDLRTCTALVILVASAPGQRASAPPSWDKTPVSKLPEKVAAMAAAIVAAAPEGKIVVTPFQSNASKHNRWHAESHVTWLLRRALRARKREVVDVEPFLMYVRTQQAKRKKKASPNVSFWKRPALLPFRYSKTVIKQAAERSRADVVILGGLQTGGRTSKLTYKVYGGELRKRLLSKSFTLKNTDLDLRHNTPPANREVIAWCEERYGKKIDRGECWDLANRSLRDLGIEVPGGSTVWGEPLGPDDAVLPGDIIQWNRKETGGRHHTVVVQHVIGMNYYVLHQNWASGKERGRKIGKGHYFPRDLRKARIYRPLPRPAQKD